MITVSVNGQMHQFQPPLDVAGLLEALDLAGKRVAVECNGAIVPKSQHGSTPIADGDRIEIVVAVGGG